MQQTLANKRILLGISGGIAAYKSADLVRRLKERGAEVRVILTDAAQHFITPLTLQALSGNPVSTSLLDPAAEAAMGHIELAKWADIMLIAPASADVIARMAHGLANDLLTTCVLATAAPVAPDRRYGGTGNATPPRGPTSPAGPCALPTAPDTDLCHGWRGPPCCAGRSVHRPACDGWTPAS